jgi:hypothetical protein
MPTYASHGSEHQRVTMKQITSPWEMRNLESHNKNSEKFRFRGRKTFQNFWTRERDCSTEPLSWKEIRFVIFRSTVCQISTNVSDESATSFFTAGEDGSSWFLWLIPIYQNTRPHIPDDRYRNTHRYTNLTRRLKGNNATLKTPLPKPTPLPRGTVQNISEHVGDSIWSTSDSKSTPAPNMAT